MTAKNHVSWVCAAAFSLALVYGVGHMFAAQGQTHRAELYQPGYIDDKDPLALFAPAELQPACRALQTGDLGDAKRAFAAAMAKHPEDAVAVVGFMQALGPQSDATLTQYERVAKATSSAQDALRLGLAALYKLDAYMPNDGAHLPQIQRLNADAQFGLVTAYRRTRAPVVGFILVDAAPVINIGLLSHNKQLYEAMLYGLGGAHIYNQYLYARDNGWSADTPDVPPLSQQNLRIFHRIVQKLWAMNGILTWDSRSGRNGPPPYTKSQVAAMKFLQNWAQKIGTHIKS